MYYKKYLIYLYIIIEWISLELTLFIFFSLDTIVILNKSRKREKKYFLLVFLIFIYIKYIIFERISEELSFLFFKIYSY